MAKKKRTRRTPAQMAEARAKEIEQQSKEYRESPPEPPILDAEYEDKVEDIINAIVSPLTQDALQEKHDNKPIGLGDMVDKVTTVTGIKKLVKFIAGDDCGCDERKETLNNLQYSVRREPKCLTEEEYSYLNTFFNRESKNTVRASENVKLTSIHNRVFGLKSTGVSSCSKCVIQIVTDLTKVYETYQ